MQLLYGAACSAMVFLPTVILVCEMETNTTNFNLIFNGLQKHDGKICKQEQFQARSACESASPC